MSDQEVSMAVEARFDRSLAEGIDGAFLSYGLGSDCDGAFDDAVLTDRFDLGVSSGIPSLAAVESDAPRIEFESPVHPHAAVRLALDLLRSGAPGEVYAIAVSPLKEFVHRTLSVTLTDPQLDLPSGPCTLWADPDLFAYACDLVELGPAEEAVSGVIARKWPEKFKVSVSPAAGARQVRFAVCAAGSWEPLTICDSAPAARRFALGLARTKGAGPGSWHVVPVVHRSEEAFSVVERQRVACKVPVKVLVAKRKNPARSSVQGWLFAGRLPAL